MIKVCWLLCMAILSSGCVSINYKVPESVPLSSLKVFTNYDGRNMPVRYHGSAECQDPEGRLVAMLNSVTIGIDGGREAEVQLVSGQQATISIMTVLPFDVGVVDVIFVGGREDVARKYVDNLRQHYITFTPLAGRAYQLEYLVEGKSISMVVYDLLDGEKVELTPERFSESCK